MNKILIRCYLLDYKIQIQTYHSRHKLEIEFKLIITQDTNSKSMNS